MAKAVQVSFVAPEAVIAEIDSEAAASDRSRSHTVLSLVRKALAAVRNERAAKSGE